MAYGKFRKIAGPHLSQGMLDMFEHPMRMLQSRGGKGSASHSGRKKLEDVLKMPVSQGPLQNARLAATLGWSVLGFCFPRTACGKTEFVAVSGQ